VIKAENVIKAASKSLADKHNIGVYSRQVREITVAIVDAVNKEIEAQVEKIDAKIENAKYFSGGDLR